MSDATEVCTDVLNGYRIAVVHGGIPVDLPGYPPPVSLEVAMLDVEDDSLIFSASCFHDFSVDRSRVDPLQLFVSA